MGYEYNAFDLLQQFTCEKFKRPLAISMQNIHFKSIKQDQKSLFNYHHVVIQDITTQEIHTSLQEKKCQGHNRNTESKHMHTRNVTHNC